MGEWIVLPGGHEGGVWAVPLSSEPRGGARERSASPIADREPDAVMGRVPFRISR